MSSLIQRDAIHDNILDTVDDTKLRLDRLERYPFVKQGMVINPKDAPYYATGDGVTDDLDTLQSAYTAGAEQGKAVDLGSSTYLVTDELDASGVTIISNGATIKRATGSGYVMSAVGSVGSYSNLDSNATAGEFTIECAAIASTLAVGDLIKIVSDAYFDVSEASFQGEMALVDRISGADITLKTPLWDSYTTTNVARVAKVIPVKFNIVGPLTIQSLQLIESNVTYGLKLYYTVNTYIDNLTVRDTSVIGIEINSCFAPNITAHVPGTLYTSTGNSYGISIGNTTMYGLIKGQYFGHRHAVAFGGTASVLGVSWGCKVIGVHGSDIMASTVFDAHGSTGDVEFIDCTAYGGTLATPAVTYGGFGVGARHCRITNCRVIGITSAILLRSDAVIAELIVRGLNIEGCEQGLNYNKATTSIDYLEIDGLHGRLSADNGAYYAINISAGDEIAKWSFRNINIRNGGLFACGGTITLPSFLEISNSYCDGTTTPSDISTWAGVRLNDADITHVRLNNVSIIGKARGMFILQSVTSLELINCNFDGNLYHVYLNTSIDADNVYIKGGSYLNSTHVDANLGIVNYTSALNADVLMVDGVETDEVYIVGASGGAVTALIGVNNVPSGFTDWTRGNTASRVDVFGGGPVGRRILACNGSPESAITAPIGSLCLRKDGGANTTLYIKESGTGNTGWAAM